MKTWPLQNKHGLLPKPKNSFMEFMRKSSVVGLNLQIKRDKSPARDINLQQT